MADQGLPASPAPGSRDDDDALVALVLGRDLGLSPSQALRCLVVRADRLAAPAGALPALVNGHYGAGSLRVCGLRTREVWITARVGSRSGEVRGRARARTGEDPLGLRARALYRATELWFGDLLLRVDILDPAGGLLGATTRIPQGVSDQLFARLDSLAAALGRAGAGGPAIPRFVDATAAARLLLAWERRLADIQGQETGGVPVLPGGNQDGKDRKGKHR